MAQVKFSKVRDVKSPNRGTEKSAGIDFYIPNDFPGVHYLIPGDAVNIPSGIRVELPEGTAGIFMNKSGVATKKDLQVGACVVDEDYQGELHLHVRNIGTDVQELEPGDKIVQMIIVPVIYADVIEVDDKDLHMEESQRGKGGFGSTGNK